eukprot:CAMPEP_0174837182 /NCGR_PEP_ID=MMETSP1114-20130205/6569_1 /TAXON_ID=312471 /ORGANISM="Neobodo designis, Strain CCAP 1951/1" /LENGTH=740 /DNA_ID=CAMNT_0016071231 /DNA_START=1 /DNA_END=2220 /DNA_ORIENTATION=+
MRRATPACNPRLASAAGLTGAWMQLRFITQRDDVRNIAVIAHVDHGKTTLVDALLKESGTLVDARGRVMDSNDQEKERGITILAKNTAIVFGDGRRVNIVDTPGHLDFSGEVERALQMVEGFVLLVDAAEGVKPGTRYVLRKALTLGLSPIVCVNKIDKDDERVEQIVEQIQELFLETATCDEQIDNIYFLYGSGRNGYFNETPVKGGDMKPLFQAMFDKVPPPKQKSDDEPFKMLVALVDETANGEHQVAIGRVFQGSVKVGDVVKVVLGDEQVDALVKEVKAYRGVHQEDVPEAQVGDIIWMALKPPLDSRLPLKIGGSVCNKDNVQAHPYTPPDEPTYTLVLTKNNASWAGKEAEGNATAQMIKLRKTLRKELMVNQALQIDNLDGDEITLRGRGPLHLSVLIESLRRMGFEFELRAPSVVRREIDGQMCEPFERLAMEYPQSCANEVMSLVATKHGEVVDIKNVSDERLAADVLMPVRLMTDLSTRFNKLTGGRGVFNHVFDGYHPEVPVDSIRETGTLCAQEDGIVQQYSLGGLSANGRFFVQHGDDVYYGQVVGENTKVFGQDMPVNVCKKNEQLGGFRANAADKANRRTMDYSYTPMGLEEYLSWVTPEELITVTPKSIRARLGNFAGKTIQRNKAGGGGGGKKKKEGTREREPRRTVETPTVPAPKILSLLLNVLVAPLWESARLSSSALVSTVRATVASGSGPLGILARVRAGIVAVEGVAPCLGETLANR